ncbi:MAG TPA: pilus assembly protein TadG-related protein [Acidimicrobiia bacterium]|jgi:hypothetical protein
MKHLRDMIRAKEKGAVLIWVAGALVALLGAAALGTDLGWLLLSTNRVQKATDAAALAGVISLPGFTGIAQTDATGASSANGFPVSAVQWDTPPSCGGTNTCMMLKALDDNSLQVDLTVSVRTFFLRVFGINQMRVTRRSTAEWVKPVPMGSPNNCFGEPVGTSGCPDPNFWGAISGPGTTKLNGDAFATQCVTISPCVSNSEYQRGPGGYDGYYYAVEVFPGTTGLTVDVYDAGFYERGDFDTQTGDHQQDTNGGTNTRYEFRNVDNTPLDPTNNPVNTSQCATWNIPTNSSNTSWRNSWQRLCSFSGSLTPGLYFLHVQSSGNLGGTNQYSVRADSGSGPKPRVYGVNDMSIFTNQPSRTALVNIAEVDQDYEGQFLELRFFDPGEDDEEAWMTVLRPDGSVANCTWSATNGNGGTGPCSIRTSSSSGALYNGHWITATIDIGDPYTCSTNCWFKMQIQLSEPHDRTVWTARVIGNPVRLTTNAP